MELTTSERFVLEALDRLYVGIVVAGCTEVLNGTLYINGRVAAAMRRKGLIAHRPGAGYNQRLGLSSTGRDTLASTQPAVNEPPAPIESKGR